MTRIQRSMQVVLVGAMSLAGAASCNFGGPEEQQPLYKIPSGKRVLVFVDVRPNLAAPPEFAAQLGQAISDKLQQYKGADVIVPQGRLLELKQNPAHFSQMGIADIAQATGADYVLHVDLVGFNVAALSDESITEGAAQALIKVVDRKGARMWPSSVTMGGAVDARIDPAFSEQRDRAGVQREITNRLAVRIARVFVKYRTDDPVMAK